MTAIDSSLETLRHSVPSDVEREADDYTIDGVQPRLAFRPDDADEAARQCVHFSLLNDGFDRFPLVVAGDQRAADQAAQIVALADHFLQAAQVVGDRIEGFLALAQIVQSGRVPLGYAAQP